jgi:predicted transposase/invertase (TIGR01784 family)
MAKYINPYTDFGFKKLFGEEMPMFTKEEHELETHFDKWIYFLKKLETFDDIPAILREPIFEKAFKAAEVANMTPEQRDEYEQSRLSYLEVKEAVNTAEMDGRKKEKMEIAKEMKKEGFDNATIKRLTGLSDDEIDKL